MPYQEGSSSSARSSTGVPGSTVGRSSIPTGTKIKASSRHMTNGACQARIP